MTTRGKFVWGKTEEGMFKAEAAPARQRATQMKTIVREC
jgi:hypothetical protein